MDRYRILVPTDFSDCSQLALQYAAVLVRAHPKAELVLLHVDQGIMPINDEQLGVLEPSRLMNLLKLRASEDAAQADIQIEELVIYGDPKREIIEVARDREADLIVMGTHGRGGFDRLVIGSVAAAVLRQASCPVLVVKGSVSKGSPGPMTPPADGGASGDNPAQASHRWPS